MNQTIVYNFCFLDLVVNNLSARNVYDCRHFGYYFIKIGSLRYYFDDLNYKEFVKEVLGFQLINQKFWTWSLQVRHDLCVLLVGLSNKSC